MRLFSKAELSLLPAPFGLSSPASQIKRNNGFTSYHYFEAWQPTNRLRDLSSSVTPLSLNQHIPVTEYKPFLHRATPPIEASP